jgi:methionine synthase II (cobalamin-independent)
MKAICEDVILFLDEPGLSGYGSAFFSVDGPTITWRLNEAVEEFQAQGARVGVHCCGNTDWSLLLSTKADIINFDAWGFLERFSLYPEAVRDFLSRGGVLAWGIVPTSELTGRETVEVLMEKLEAGFRDLMDKGIPEKILHERCLLTPSCGMGLMSVEDAEKAMGLLVELSKRMREKYC